MSELEQRVQLPQTELGENRCFSISYYGHGDIHIAAWAGGIDDEIDEETPDVANFGIRHGTDVRILGSLIGYLRRSGVSEDDISEIMTNAGKDVLEDGYARVDNHRYPVEYARKIATGKEDEDSLDDEEDLLQCLMYPEPSRPGRIEVSGGTGIYTKIQPNGEMLLVFVGFNPSPSQESYMELDIAARAEFCQADVPKLARAICDLALGEYRLDLEQLLLLEFVADPEEVE